MTQIVVHVMYNAPDDPAAFESYYEQVHLPIAARVPSVEKLVLLKGLPGGDGSAPAYYRVAQLFFADAASMEAAMSSPEAQAAVEDIVNFATGGYSVFVAEAT